MVYGLGAITAKAIPFLLIPLFTRIFSPQDYGYISMYSTVSNILAIFMTAGLDGAQSFFFMEAKNKKNCPIEKVTTSIFQLRMILGLIVSIICAIFSPLIVRLFFNQIMPFQYILLVICTTFFSSMISQSIEVFRLIYQPWRYILISFLQSSLGPVISIGLIIEFHWYLTGYFAGFAIASIIVTFYGWLATRKYRYWYTLETDLWRPFLQFGAVFIPSGLLIWILSGADRWFVLRILGAKNLGIYAVGAQISTLIALAVTIFRQAWWPVAMDAIHHDDGPEFFRKIALWYVGLGSLGAVLITFLSPYLIRLLAPSAYYSGWRVVGPMAWSSIFYGFYLIGGMGIFKSRKTYLNFFIDIISVTVNITLNLILIPLMGIMGAAIATALSIGISNLITMNISNRYYPVKWQWAYYGLFMTLSLGCIVWLLI
ncbi:MAG: hypothetical protein A2X77_04740 [Gammaproteobacteria bacterium GWE2_42_36]|nr:MAG: hypothetical protein A2X77_04740 [Gammaproteobacteria bacterium GWE2_42_36]